MLNYYDYFKKEIETYKDKVEPFMLHLPGFLQVLFGLMGTDPDQEDKNTINAALGYLVLPHDFVPEKVFGPMGYIDDLFVMTSALHKLAGKLGMDTLVKHWENEIAFEDSLKEAHEKSKAFLDGKNLTEEVLVYTGLE